MAQVISIQKEELKPRIICGHCKQEVQINIDPFQKDCTKILRDNCPVCRGEIFVGLLILSHTNMNGLLACIEAVINTLKQVPQIIGGKKQ